MSCAVNCCKNRRVRGGLRFYCFPSDPKRRVLWIKAAQRFDLLAQPEKKTKQRRICSAHFVTGKFSTNPTHPDYVPSIFPFNKNSENSRITRRVQRFVRHKRRAEAAGSSFTPLYPPGHPSGRLHDQSSAQSQPQLPELQPPSPSPSGPLFVQLPVQIPQNGQPPSGGVQIRLPGYPHPVQLQVNDVNESRSTFFLIYNPSEGTRDQVWADYEIDAELAFPGDHTYCKNPDSAPVEPVKTCNCKKSCQHLEPQEPSQHRDSGQNQEVTKKGEKRGTNEDETIAVLNETQEAEEAQTTVEHKETNAPTEQNSGEQLKLMQCPVCGRYFLSLPHFASHIQKHVAERFQCEVCDKKVRCKSELEHHTQMHNVEKIFCCSYCGRRFQRKKSMKAHERKHEADLVCSYCGKAFRNEDFLEKHLLKHEAKMQNETEQANGQGLQHETNPPSEASQLPKYNFQCSECDKSFIKQNRLDDHMTQHTGLRPHQCSICSKYYGTKDHLRKHTKIHTGEKRHKCAFCDRKFWANAKLQVHIQAKHTEKTFECTGCSRKFATHAKMKTHSKTHNFDHQKPYHCPVCLHNFESLGIAEEHIEIHKKEREMKGQSIEHSDITVKYSGPQFLCTECGKTFYLKVSLVKHMQFTHTNERFSCTLCSLKFNFKTTLNSHLKSHNGEKPFSLSQNVQS